MTIKKIGLSAIAATVVATGAIAGTITTNNAGLIGTEYLSITDANVTDATGGAVYTPTQIPAGALKNPIFKFTFANASNIVANSNLKVYQVLDGNESNATEGNLLVVADTPVVSGANSEVISFNAVTGDTYVYNNKKYVIRDNNNTLDADLNITVMQGSISDVTLAADLFSGDSQASNDHANASTIYTIGQEFSALVTQKFDARIDASQNFYQFFDRGEDLTGATRYTADTMTVSILRNATEIGLADLGGEGTGPSINVITSSDTNLTKNAYSVKYKYNGALVDVNADDVNDYNSTILNVVAAAANTTSQPFSIVYTVDGQSKIEKTQFGVDTYVAAADHRFTLIADTGSNAGAWTIYGYNAQIPNAAATDTTETVLKFTNRSGLNTDIFFTLIDPDGTIATVSSVDNPELAALPTNTTGKYTVSTLLSLVTDPEFDKAHSISIEVAIPTTPSSVYGSASFLNSASGQFKDLPVYNTSTMTY